MIDSSMGYYSSTLDWKITLLQAILYPTRCLMVYWRVIRGQFLWVFTSLVLTNTDTPPSLPLCGCVLFCSQTSTFSLRWGVSTLGTWRVARPNSITPGILGDVSFLIEGLTALAEQLMFFFTLFLRGCSFSFWSLSSSVVHLLIWFKEWLCLQSICLFRNTLERLRCCLDSRRCLLV